ncbi:hypothetical protein, partial [Paraburkholderia caribensis]|uniref:hypothetical protein n=1 Tax=Paraburkholderia caribensis TaxID=75105 RepID=UPI0031DB4D25
LLFFAAAKKSRCRPAQGQRVKHANVTRMPAQRHKTKTKTKTRRAAKAARDPPLSSTHIKPNQKQKQK